MKMKIDSRLWVYAASLVLSTAIFIVLKEMNFSNSHIVMILAGIAIFCNALNSLGNYGRKGPENEYLKAIADGTLQGSAIFAIIVLS